MSWPTGRGLAGGLLAGVAWAASGVAALVMIGPMGGLRDLPDPLVETTEWFVISALHAVAYLGMLALLLALRAAARDFRRWGLIGFVAATGGTALVFLATVVALAVRGGTLVQFAVLLLGVLGWLVGFPLLGAATLRTGVLPRWTGWLLIAFVPLVVVLFLVLDVYGIGGLVLGALWIALAYALAQGGNAPQAAEQRA